MSLPMGLCADRRGSINPLCLLKNNQNPPTMFDKGVSVFPNTSGCSADIMNHRETKSNPMFTQTASFHSKSRLIPFESLFYGELLGGKRQCRITNTPQNLQTIVVGGFLGRKSQCRNSSTPSLSDMIITVVDWFQAAMIPLTSQKQCDFIYDQSPSKKKFMKEESSSNLDKEDQTEIPPVIKVPKQSYADIAKAPSCKQPTSDRSPPPKDNTTARRTNSNRRRSHTGERRPRRKSNRQDLRETSPQQTSERIPLSPSPRPQLESWKGTKLIQDRNSCQINSAKAKGHNKGDRHCKSSSNSPRKDLMTEKNSDSHMRRRCHPNFRSHCDNRRGTRARNIDCDIDMINWRTGEPIVSKMDSQNDSDNNIDENFSSQYSLCDGSTSLHENDDDCINALKKLDFSSSDAAAWPDLESASPPLRRRRFSSECSVDSEDSFVVFLSGPPPDPDSDLGSDWSDCESDDNYDSNSDSLDEVDYCDEMALRLKEVNDRWLRESAESCPVGPNDKSSKAERKVHFDEAKPTIHRMLTWDFAYRSSRVGPWEEMARDRGRFKTRIQQFEGIISPVLSPNHRNKIWKRLISVET